MYGEKPQGWVKHADFILLDMLCLQAAFVLSYITRHGFKNPYASELYQNMAVVYALIDVLLLIVNSTMKDVLKRGYYKEIAQTAKHVILGTLMASICLFSLQYGEEYSRITFYLMAIYYFIISYGLRLLWKWFLRRRNRENLRSAIYFVTTSDRAEQVISRFQKNNVGTYHVQGVCLLDCDKVDQTICDVPVIATEQTLVKYLCDKWVDEIFISLPVSYPYPAELINTITEMGIVTHVQMEQMHVEGWQHQVIEEVAGFHVRTLSMTMATSRQLFLKRALDIVGGIMGCILTGILALIIGPMIYIKSPGPIFFTQTRVGKNGKKFKMYKFRSMYLGAEAKKAELMAQNRHQGGLMFKLEYDPRIIGCEKLPDGTIKKGIGNFIRDWSIDEFPQFLNVLKGDLSLCGTRPPTEDEWEKYELHHRARLAIKPGITGLWQISGRSNITNFEQVVELDKKYIREWSMGLDCRILLQTIKVVLSKDGSM
jgi:exopolysaccharide biosynthesis polyprenyl glycosylphosphotransferase